MALNKETDFCEKISSEIKITFIQLYDALKNREVQLLRQVEVLEQHYKLTDSYDNCFKEVMVIFDNEKDILKSISNFGRIDLNGLSCDSEIFKIEDYQKPEIDHVSLYKYLENSFSDHLNTANNVKIDNNKLMKLIEESNVEEITTQELLTGIEEPESDINTSEISNTILECIEKGDPSLCLHVINEGEPESKENITVKIKSNELSPTENETKGISSCDINSEITNLSSQCLNNSASVPNLNCKCSDNSKSSVAGTKLQKDSLTQSAKNLNDITNVSTKEDYLNVPEQVKIISMKQPIQIQQWMKQIISETEVEPHANNMEHSQLEILRKDSD